MLSTVCFSTFQKDTKTQDIYFKPALVSSPKKVFKFKGNKVN